MDNSKPVDHPDRETVAVRQGTGPRATVSVLLVSLLMMAAVGVAFPRLLQLGQVSAMAHRLVSLLQRVHAIPTGRLRSPTS